MKHVSRSLFACAVVCVLSGGFLAGCSSDDDTSDAATTTEAAKTNDSANDSTDSTDDSTSGSDAGADVCTLITPDEVAAIVGGPVTVEEQPGGGCAFNQDDPRATTLAFASVPSTDTTDGTFNETRVGAFGTLTDPTKEEPGVGDYSAVASGKLGGDNEQGVGVVQVGTSIVQITLVQANGIDGAQVRTMTTDALKLAASKL